MLRYLRDPTRDAEVNYVLVFLAAFLLDVGYCRWMLHVRDAEPLRAALASVFIGACSLVGLTGVVGDTWTAPAYLGGLFVGTLVGMRR
jgi:hypothetical protein